MQTEKIEISLQNAICVERGLKPLRSRLQSAALSNHGMDLFGFSLRLHLLSPLTAEVK